MDLRSYAHSIKSKQSAKYERVKRPAQRHWRCCVQRRGCGRRTVPRWPLRARALAKLLRTLQPALPPSHRTHPSDLVDRDRVRHILEPGQ